MRSVINSERGDIFIIERRVFVSVMAIISAGVHSVSAAFVVREKISCLASAALRVCRATGMAC